MSTQGISLHELQPLVTILPLAGGGRKLSRRLIGLSVLPAIARGWALLFVAWPRTTHFPR